MNRTITIKGIGKLSLKPDLTVVSLTLKTVRAGYDKAMDKAAKHLEQLRGCEVHSSVILSSVDEATFHKLGINLTCEPKYQTEKLFHH